MSAPATMVTDASDRAMTTAVHDAVRTVHDPEYPDVSIVDLGLVESVGVDTCRATVGLIPTFSGCPALDMIAADVRTAVESVDGIDHCDVRWLAGPVWSTDRLSATAERTLAEYTVVLRRKDGTLRCPICGGDAVDDRSAAGPTRCRSVAWCSDCRNPVEVMR